MRAHPRRQPLFRLDDSDAAVVAELCRCLDGLPRALEFAGRWTLVRALAELLAEVKHSPFGLTAPPMTAEPARDLMVRLRRTLGRLSPAGVSFLATVARDHRSWSVAEAAAAVGTSGADAAVIVFTLVTYGLVRPESPGVRNRASPCSTTSAICTPRRAGNPGAGARR